jgi:two-component system response regulator FixJ
VRGGRRGTDGIALTHELLAQQPALPVVLMSGQADIHMAVSAIKAGAQDFIEKPIDDARLVAAINRGLARLFERQGEEYSIDMLATHFARLTPRQIEIFDLVAAGCTSHAIATKLGISRRTVENHRAEIMERMQAESIAEIVRQAIRLKRISLM